jgi:hypothetical protein
LVEFDDATTYYTKVFKRDYFILKKWYNKKYKYVIMLNVFLLKLFL